MTEKEIIKRLECCSKVSFGICRKCPYYSIPSYECSYLVKQHALNLINRQKAEIEELTEKHHNKCRQIAKYDDSLRQYKRSLLKYQKKELERINGNMNSIVNEDRLLKDILTAPVTFIPVTNSKEAVKTFAEALKAELKNLSKVHLFGREFALVGENFIDGVVEKYEGGEGK